MPISCTFPAGTLPASNSSEAFPSLTVLHLENNTFGGSLPPGWASPGMLPALAELYLSENLLTGPLPIAWGSSTAFQQLTLM